MRMREKKRKNNENDQNGKMSENSVVKVSLRARAFSVRLEPRRHTWWMSQRSEVERYEQILHLINVHRLRESKDV